MLSSLSSFTRHSTLGMYTQSNQIVDKKQEEEPPNQKLWAYLVAMGMGLISWASFASSDIAEPVQACVIEAARPLDRSARSQIADCLGWRHNPQLLCQGDYTPISVITPEDEAAIHLSADYAS